MELSHRHSTRFPLNSRSEGAQTLSASQRSAKAAGISAFEPLRSRREYLNDQTLPSYPLETPVHFKSPALYAKRQTPPHHHKQHILKYYVAKPPQTLQVIPSGTARESALRGNHPMQVSCNVPSRWRATQFLHRSRYDRRRTSRRLRSRIPSAKSPKTLPHHQDADAIRLEDLGSSNGTFHNGERVREATLAAATPFRSVRDLHGPIDGVPRRRNAARHHDGAAASAAPNLDDDFLNSNDSASASAPPLRPMLQSPPPPTTSISTPSAKRRPEASGELDFDFDEEPPQRQAGLKQKSEIRNRMTNQFPNSNFEFRV